jgi:hypothetical protein
VPEQDPARAPKGNRVYGSAKTPRFRLATESSIESEDWTELREACQSGRRTRVCGQDDTYRHEREAIPTAVKPHVSNRF